MSSTERSSFNLAFSCEVLVDLWELFGSSWHAMPSRQICQHPPTPSICVHVSSHLSGKTGVQAASAQARSLEVELLRDYHCCYFAAR
jgi:hypothetical protein